MEETESKLFKGIKKKKDNEEQLTSEEKKLFSELNSTRSKAKTVNFAAMYKAGYKKIAETANIPLEQAKFLLEVYWKRNEAVLKASKDFKIKTLENDSMWVFNPVSKLWYNLRNLKDVFSTVNQSTAAYCFDLYVQLVKKEFAVIGQFHDEIIISLIPEKKKELENYLNVCVEKANEKLKLNVPIGISMDFGTNYAEIH
jgi:DNA polymerase I-like protein with 3'-5' exonuclease and polymerase domains